MLQQAGRTVQGGSDVARWDGFYPEVVRFTNNVVVTLAFCLSNYPKTLSSPGFYGGYTPFSDSYLARLLPFFGVFRK